MDVPQKLWPHYLPGKARNGKQIGDNAILKLHEIEQKRRELVALSDSYNEFVKESESYISKHWSPEEIEKSKLRANKK